MVTYTDIIRFWFEETDASKWWEKDAEFDQLITERYGQVHESATRCELYEWRVHPEGRLAEIMVLDQFSRNMYRDRPLAFAYDAQALVLSQEAVACGVDEMLNPEQRGFLYLPYMHSESRKIHETALALYTKKGSAANLEFELKHKAIIDRFGRYPHRNNILERVSTQEEIDFLRTPGSSF